MGLDMPPDGIGTTDPDPPHDPRDLFGLRSHWVGRGHRPSEVAEVVDRLLVRIETLEAELATSRRTIAIHEQHARDALFVAQRIAAREGALERQLLEGELPDLEERATAAARARDIVQAAEDEAERARAEAKAEARRVGRDIEVLLAARGRTLLAVEELRNHLDRVTAVLPTVESRPPDASERVIEVHAGPFPDFVALSDFERELAAVPGVEDVHVVSFAAQQAVIDLRVEPDLGLDELCRAVPPSMVLDVRDEHSITVELAPAAHEG